MVSSTSKSSYYEDTNNKANTTFSLPHPGEEDGVQKLKVIGVKQVARKAVVKNNISLRYAGGYIRWSYTAVFVMYLLLFTVGLGTAVLAIIKGFLAQNETDTFSTLIFAGLSAATFFTLFITRPLNSLEGNASLSSWLIAVMNSYWIQIMNFNEANSDPMAMNNELQTATTTLISQLSALVDKQMAVEKGSAPTDSAVNGAGQGQSQQQQNVNTPTPIP